jgi:hypothetical protein
MFMIEVLTPRKTDLGWVIDLPPEMAQAMKISPDSIVVLYPREGALETEILPPPSAELQADFERLFDKYQDTFEELKRLGD